MIQTVLAAQSTQKKIISVFSSWKLQGRWFEATRRLQALGGQMKVLLFGSQAASLSVASIFLGSPSATEMTW